MEGILPGPKIPFFLLLLSFYSLQAKDSLPPIELYFSLEGGFFNQPLEIELSAPGAEIFYTLNGNHPSRKSRRYDQPIPISETTIVRAVAYRDKEHGPILSQTYFLYEPTTQLPVVSIGISPWLLFDREHGMFMLGSKADHEKESKPGANFWTRREVSASVEIYESDGRCVYNNRSGFRLFGGMSRLFPQKSIALVARKQFGPSRFDHPLFGEGGPDKVKFFILRNGGSDYHHAHFRDALITSVTKNWNLDVQAHRTALVYINGKYWGVYHIREKINRYFINDHHDIDKDSLDILEHQMTRKRGSRRHYLRMLDYLKTHSLADPANYAYIWSQMEVDNYMDHQIAQIYFDNRDAGGNIRFWRPQNPHGRWRWILYDTDWGMGLYDHDAWQNNSLAFHTEAHGPSWPNPPWSTFILRKLMENKRFQQDFLNRFADRLNTNLKSEAILEEIARFYRQMEPEMPRHLDRWKLPAARWEREVEVLRTFARERPAVMWDQLQTYFQAGPRRPVYIAAKGGGSVIINNNLEITDTVFQGTYFEGVPISLTAIPLHGYRFSHWEGIGPNNSLRELHLDPGEGIRLRAVFERYTHPLAGKIMINEVCPTNKKTKDWIELYNHSDERVYLQDWLLKDKNRNTFRFPNAPIAPHDYLVVCEDSTAFRKAFPLAYNIIGGLPFGINKVSEQLELFSADGAGIDSMGFQLPPTDSAFTLGLLLPWLDNAQADNWRVLSGFGSPNAANPYYVESSIRKRQHAWMQMGVSAAVAILCGLLLFFRNSSQKEKPG